MTDNQLISVHKPEGQSDFKVLFLGYDRQTTRLIDVLTDANCEVHQTSGPVPIAEYDIAVSFGYRHIIGSDVIARFSCPIINLHISYLPYNKGAHPNFWSFYDGTPAGVTIHLIDDGLDTGPILFQKRVKFAETDVTFADTQKRLVEQIEQLFCENLSAILSKQWTARPQTTPGTVHYKRDLPENFQGWNSIVEDEIKRLQAIAGTSDA